MTQLKNNLRIRRTQKLLREALIELIEERGFDSLTVGEITKHAMIGRATFYRNYKDKYDLVEQIYSEAMQPLLNTLSESGSEHPPQIWASFFEHIAKYERLYRALLGRKGSPWFVMKMRVSLVDLVEQITHQQPKTDLPFYPSSDTLVPDLVATMFLEAITWWLEQGRPYPPQEIARRCVLLASAIFKETSTWN